MNDNMAYHSTTILEHDNRNPQPGQPKESRLKTMLLGTLEQRRTRVRNDIKNHPVLSLAKIILQPGYSTIATTQLPDEREDKKLAVKFGVGLDILKTIIYCKLAYEIANKLGQYFAQ